MSMIDTPESRPPQWGITPPMSLDPPTDQQLELTKALVGELERRETFESAEECRTREVVLGRLDQLVKEFVKKVYVRKGQSEAAVAEAGGKIFTSGSYRLAVHGPGDDIDTLCVVPRYVDHDDFFSVFVEMLKERKEISKLVTVTEAFVPIIKITFSGVDVDLLLARLALSSIPDDLDLHDNNLLRNLDDRSVVSMGGPRATDEILRLVPDPDVFRIALRAIRLWAKKRAIYSNILGFCGGVAWAIMVARVCQSLPYQTASGIVNKFFTVMLLWKWPRPIYLKHYEESNIPLKVWNPKIYSGDEHHRMPIITPAFPSMCSTHNVSFSTQEVMIQEFHRGSEISHKIAVGQAQWSELFEPTDFFTRYRHYIQITATSGNDDLQRRWSGTVESKLRYLIKSFESHEAIRIVHPYYKGFHRRYVCSDQAESSRIMNGEAPSKEVEERTKKYQEDEEIPEDCFHLYTSTFYFGLQIEKRPDGQTGMRQLNFTMNTNKFYDTVKRTDVYDEQNTSIRLLNMKGSDLPLFVFPNGERPSKKRKKHAIQDDKADGASTPEISSKNSENASKKLKAAEQSPSNLDENGTPYSAAAAGGVTPNNIIEPASTPVIK